MPTITVHLFADYEKLYLAQEERLGERFEGSAGFVWWTRENDPEILSMYDERYEGRRQHTASLLHEFTHLASTAINSSISNNPRWLWESIALYETGEARGNLPRIEYLIAGDYPTIAELNVGFNEANEARNIYQFGYVIGAYIVSEWGIDGLISLIKSNGDIPGTLGVSSSEFDSAWHSFMEEEYL
jgi:hypothetical protein